jgi:hypothetical protein
MNSSIEARIVRLALSFRNCAEPGIFQGCLTLSIPAAPEVVRKASLTLEAAQEAPKE